eukprot:TRINITY_DN352_c0_g1_i1.p1 TRINITY_DN352_c0_g1~~TRINITY_DN352_c0_g1_i1.p1  ORF type:complete len:188 (+),score=63.09 TRINITY_DN352_c0_g1_i1:24-587(+)
MQTQKHFPLQKRKNFNFSNEKISKNQEKTHQKMSTRKKLSREELKKIWDVMDYNGNGIVSLAEIDKACIELYPELAKDKPALIRAYKAADSSKDGFIERKEFAILMDYLFYYDKLWHDFQKLDVDHDRRVSLVEFEKGHEIAGLHGKHSKADLKKAFDSIDTNHGGFILFEEFCNYVAKQKAKEESA